MKLMQLPLRFKLTLVCLVGLVIFALGNIVLFSRAWVDLSRSYGLLNINRRLESPDNIAKSLEEGEWAVNFQGTGAELIDITPNWIKEPSGLTPDQSKELARRVFKSVVATHLAAGSFELPIDPENAANTYFVAFRETPAGRTAVATRAHRSLWDLSPWAAPFLGFFLVALLVTTGLIYVLTDRLSRAYTLLAKAMRDVGAGRLENLELPKGRDESIQSLSQSLGDMAQLLATKEKRISEVSQLADEDAMTGMKNYRAFSNYMSGVFDQKKAKLDTFPVLAIVDLDFFKKVNDNYGHQVGDFVLRNTAKIIKKSIRFESAPGRMPDFCGRYGGEEFVVIFSECTKENYHMAAERLMQEIKAAKLTIPDEINEKGMGKEISVSASIGIACWDPKRFANKEEWIKEADGALYQAKHRGRARLVVTHPDLKEWT